MTAAREKQLETRVSYLERMLSEVLVRTGMDRAALDQMKYRDAIESHDPRKIKAYLQEVNGRRQ